MNLTTTFHKDLLSLPILKVSAADSIFGFESISHNLISKPWVQLNAKNMHGDEIELFVSVEHSPSILGKEVGQECYSLNANVSSSFKETLRLINTFTFLGNKYDFAVYSFVQMFVEYLKVIDEQYHSGISKTIAVQRFANVTQISSIIDGANYFLTDEGLRSAQIEFPNEVVQSEGSYKYSFSLINNDENLKYFVFSNSKTGQLSHGVLNLGADIRILREGNQDCKYYSWHYRSDMYRLMHSVIHQTALFFRTHSITTAVKKEKTCFDLNFLATFFGQLFSTNGNPIKIGNTELSVKEVLKELNLDLYDLANGDFSTDQFESMDFNKLGLYGFIIFTIAESYASNKISHEHNDPEKFIQAFIEKNFTFKV